MKNKKYKIFAQKVAEKGKKYATKAAIEAGYKKNPDKWAKKLLKIREIKAEIKKLKVVKEEPKKEVKKHKGIDNLTPFKKGNKAAEKWTEKKALELGEELLDWLKEKDKEGNDKGNIMYEEFLYIEKDLYPELLSYLYNKFPTFLKLIEKSKAIQRVKAEKYGMGDRLNASMVKWFLSNHHGQSDKQQIESNNKNENKIIIEVKSPSKTKEVTGLLGDLE